MAATFPIAVAIGILATVLSPGLVLDAISLWPGMVPAVVALFFVAIRRSWRRRAGALPPLLLLSWMVLAAGAHLAAWRPLPSSSAEIMGPVTSPQAISLAIHPEGRLELSVASASEGATPVYRVGFVRLGGEVGVPAAEEIANQTGLTVAVRDSGTTPWFRYGGWQLQLAPATQWNLSVGGNITGSLVGLDLASLSVEGSGAIRLGSPGHVVPVAVRGNLSLTIPTGSPVQVLGSAQVPGSWDRTAEGARAPVPGAGWLISVAEGATLVIIEA
jgi:hypothetical protein